MNTDVQNNYTPIDWEAYCRYLDYKIENAQFWLSPLMLHITVMVGLIVYLLIGDKK